MRDEKETPSGSSTTTDANSSGLLIKRVVEKLVDMRQNMIQTETTAP